MRQKQNDLFTIAVIAAILIIFTIADLISECSLLWTKRDLTYTETDGFAVEAFLNGEYTENYRRKVQENFINHGKWDEVRYRFEILLGKEDMNGFYFGRDGYFLRQRYPETYSEEAMKESLDRLEQLVREKKALVMLVPTAEAVLEEKLPLYADVFDQKAYLEQVHSAVGDENYVDVYTELKRHSAEKIYFKTDEHWTSLGALYGYQVWWQAAGKLLPYQYSVKDSLLVKADFQGNYKKQVEIPMEEEYLLVFAETKRKPAMVWYDNGVQKAGYYRDEALLEGDAYRYYLGDGFGIARMETGYDREKSLFVIGDSFANSILPLMAPHYGKICLVNPEYFEGDWEAVLREYEEQGETEVLLLYSVPGFLDRFAR